MKDTNEIKTYSSVTLVGDQRMIMEGIAKELSRYLDMEEKIIRGMMLKITGSWQVRHQKKVQEVNLWEIKARIGFIKEGLREFRNYMVHFSGHPEDVEKIEEAVQKSFQFYLQNYAYRNMKL